MFILTLIPTSNIPRQNTLTYFSKVSVTPGTAVVAPYNKSTIYGIVIECSPLQNVKSDIKKELFQLKKIDKVLNRAVPDTYILALIEWSTEYFVPVSKVLFDIFPKSYWETTEDFPVIDTWVIAPTVNQVKSISKKVAVESKIVKKISPDTTRKISEPVTKVSSPYEIGLAFLFAKKIIFESFGDSAYHLNPLYHYDVRTLIPYLEKVSKKQIMYRDSLLPISRTSEKEILQSVSEDEKLNYTLYTKETKRHNKLFIHPKMEESFQSDIDAKKNVLLLCQHHDMHQKIVCNDCKKPIVCKTCGNERVFSLRAGVPYFRCQTCKKNKDIPAKQRCAYCESWNLEVLGITKSTVQESIRELYSKKYSHEDLKRVKVATFRDLEKFDSGDTSFHFDHIYIISLDSYMHSVSFDSEETIYRLIKKISFFGKKLSIQTSFPAPNILIDLKNQSERNWLLGELSKRKELHLPPYGFVYKLSLNSIKDRAILSRVQSILVEKDILHTYHSDQVTIYVPKEKKVIMEKFLRSLPKNKVVVKKQ